MNKTIDTCVVTGEMIKCAWQASPREIAGAEIEAMIKAALEAAPEVSDAVPMPQNADQAQLMANAGIAWLKANAPERLKPEVKAEPVAWRLTNTSYRKPRFEYFNTKEEAEQRQADFNRSVDDGGLYNLTALYLHPPCLADDEKAKSAIKSLESYGYTYLGGELWKPPLGKKPFFVVAVDLVEQMRQLTDEGRIEIMNQFCKVCGNLNPKCQCWKDE